MSYSVTPHLVFSIHHMSPKILKDILIARSGITLPFILITRQNYNRFGLDRRTVRVGKSMYSVPVNIIKSHRKSSIVHEMWNL